MDPPRRRARQLWAPRPGTDRGILVGFVPDPSARRIGADALRHPVPAAPGPLPDGCKGIIDLRPARGESAAEREHLPASPIGAALPAKASK